MRYHISRLTTLGSVIGKFEERDESEEDERKIMIVKVKSSIYNTTEASAMEFFVLFYIPFSYLFV